ncbi:hypothetical protein SAMN04515695_4963 [Pseudovibrio sp. Tun.PSC04-5.I4]|nr:hypothetical protein SAMN04515695_4963 [Pseudovibrio sp. Tun.PSC04-5.I4]
MAVGFGIFIASGLGVSDLAGTGHSLAGGVVANRAERSKA